MIRKFRRKNESSRTDVLNTIVKVMKQLGWEHIEKDFSDGSLVEKFEKDGNKVSIAVDTYTVTVYVNGKQYHYIDIDRLSGMAEWKTNLNNWINNALSKKESRKNKHESAISREISNAYSDTIAAWNELIRAYKYMIMILEDEGDIQEAKEDKEILSKLIRMKKNHFPNAL